MDARAAIRDLELWPEPPRVEAILAGYTNENFRVRSGGRSYFARAGRDLPHHGISRRNEALCSGMAARAGVAPEVVHARDGVLVTRFVEGRSLRIGAAPDRETLIAIGRLLAGVHRVPALPELPPVDLAGACRSYLALPGSERLAPEDRERLEAIVEGAPAPGAECFVHGDAFPENFIDDGRRLWLVDWEYAGRGRAAADLAYVAMNFDLTEEGLQALLEAHGGPVDGNEVRGLLPVAAARDILWCLSEIDARGLSEKLADYTRECCRRLGVAWKE